MPQAIELQSGCPRSKPVHPINPCPTCHRAQSPDLLSSTLCHLFVSTLPNHPQQGSCGRVSSGHILAWNACDEPKQLHLACNMFNWACHDNPEQEG
eukprot:1032636-Pelagomonas_calceolata.AAC.1